MSWRSASPPSTPADAAKPPGPLRPQKPVTPPIGVAGVRVPPYTSRDGPRGRTAGADHRGTETFGGGLRDLRHGDVRSPLQAPLSQLRLPPRLLRSLGQEMTLP